MTTNHLAHLLRPIVKEYRENGQTFTHYDLRARLGRGRRMAGRRL